MLPHRFTQKSTPVICCRPFIVQRPVRTHVSTSPAKPRAKRCPGETGPRSGEQVFSTHPPKIFCVLTANLSNLSLHYPETATLPSPKPDWGATTEVLPLVIPPGAPSGPFPLCFSPPVDRLPDPGEGIRFLVFFRPPFFQATFPKRCTPALDYPPKKTHPAPNKLFFFRRPSFSNHMYMNRTGPPGARYTQSKMNCGFRRFFYTPLV